LILGAIALKEKFGIKEIILLFITITGVCLVMKPEFIFNVSNENTNDLTYFELL